MNLSLHRILNSINEAILCVDDHSTVLLLNETAARLFGCDAAHAIGRAASCFPVLDEAVRQFKFSEVSAGGIAAKAVRRVRISRGDDPSMTVEAILTSAIEDGQQIYIAVIRDASVQPPFEKAGFKSRKTHPIGSLSGGIAHDFNNLLAVISDIHLVLCTPECPDALEEHLVYAQTSARGAGLIHSRQAFGQPDKPMSCFVDLTESIEHVAVVLRRSVGPKVSIGTSLSSQSAWPVKGDSSQLIQAVLNLGINVRNAMSNGGGIMITLENATFPARGTVAPRRVGDFVRVSVADTAPGKTSAVFEQGVAKNLHRGSELSLAIASAVVAEHSGWMEVESQAGKGTEYSIFLPRGIKSTATRESIARSEGKTFGGKERILVVDDEELVRFVTKAVLAYRGYQITEAEDGEDAVKKYSLSPASFDLVLMDLHMPRMNGREALHRMREINPKAKVILLSGGIHDPSDEVGQMDKRTVFLHKPFENEELVGVARKLLDSE
jgi:two-component system, cell cycle sensor histidine kinase and response regulator CckA